MSIPLLGYLKALSSFLGERARGRVPGMLRVEFPVGVGVRVDGEEACCGPGCRRGAHGGLSTVCREVEQGETIPAFAVHVPSQA